MIRIGSVINFLIRVVGSWNDLPLCIHLSLNSNHERLVRAILIYLASLD